MKAQTHQKPTRWQCALFAGLLPSLPAVGGVSTLPQEITGGLPACYKSNSCYQSGAYQNDMWSIGNTAFKFSRIDIWQDSPTSNNIFGVQMYFTNSSGSTEQGDKLGAPAASLTKVSYPIDTTKTILYVDQYGCDPASRATGWKFIYSDNTSVTVGPVDSGKATCRTTLTNQLIGFDCVHQTSFGVSLNLLGCNAIQHNYSLQWPYLSAVTQTLSVAGTTKTWRTNASVSAGETFTADLTLNGSAISVPAWMSINLTAKSLLVDTLFTSGITKADVGVYTLKLTGQIGSDIDPATGQPWTVSFTATITINSDCTLATTISGNPAVSNIVTDIGVPLSKTLAYTDNISNLHNDPNYCTKVYTLTPTHAFLTIDGSELKLSSANTADIGNYSENLKVSLVDKPTLFIDNAFTAKLTEPCRDIVFQGTDPALTDFKIYMPTSGLKTFSFKAIQFNTVQNKNMDCLYTAELVGEPKYVSLTYTLNEIVIEIDSSSLTLPNDIGSSPSFDFRLKSPYPTVSDLTIKPLHVVVICEITDFSLVAPVPDFTYYIGQGSAIVASFGLKQTSECNYSVTIGSPTQLRNGLSVGPISGLGFSFGAQQWAYSSTDTSLVRTVYTIGRKATIGVTNPATGQNWAAQISFNLKLLLNDCKTTNIINKAFGNMIYTTGTPPTTQNAQFDDEFSNFQHVYGKCGALSITFSPSKPFISYDGTDVVVQTNDLTLVGDQSVTMTVGLVDYPMVTALEKTFTVSIKCGDQSLAFNNPPILIEQRPGIDPEPFMVTFPITQSCGDPPDYSFALVSPSVYTGTGGISLNPLIDGVELRVTGVSRADAGIYHSKLIATTATANISVLFDWQVIDACSETAFATSPRPVADMFFVVGSVPTASQTTTVQTQLQVDLGIPCSFTLSLSPTAAYISLIGSDIVLNGASMNQSDLGVKNFSLIATSAFPTQVIAATYDFSVQLSCQITAVTPSVPIITQTHKLAQGVSYVPTTVEVPAFTITPAVCASSLSYQVLQLGTPVSYISVTGTTIKIDSQDLLLRGTRIYQLVATAASAPFIKGSTGSVQFKVIFELCESTTMLTPQLSFKTLNFIATHEPLIQSLPPFQDWIGAQQAVQGLCGPRKITVTPSNTFMTLTAPLNEYVDPWQVSLFTNVLTSVGTYKITVAASLVDYPSVLATSISFDVIIASPCTLTKLQLPQIADMIIKVGDPAVVQTFTQSTDTEAQLLNKPNLCGERSYSIIGAKSPITLISPQDPWKDPFKLSLQAFSANLVGEYSLTLQVTLLDYPSIVPATSAFKVVIQKPNSPPRFKELLADKITIAKTWQPQSWSFIFPSVIDEDSGDVIKITPNLGAASTFLKLVDQSKLVVDDISASHISAAFYMLKFTLDDSKSQTFYSTMLFVYDAPPKEVPKPEEPLPQPKCEVQISRPQIQTAITYVSGTSPMMVSWDSFKLKGSKECTEGKSIQVSIKTTWQDNRFANENDWLQYTASTIGTERASSYFTISSGQIYDKELYAYVQVIATAEGQTSNFDLTVTIKPASSPSAKRWVKAKPPVLIFEEVSESGLITLELDSPIIVFNRSTDPFMMDPAKYLEFTVVKNPLSSYYEDPEYIKSGKVLSITVTSFTARQIQVQLEISNPLYVSLDTFYRDQLKVRIVDESTFVSAVDFLTTSIRNSVSQIEIFRFLSKEIAASVESLQKQQTTMNALVTGSMPLNIVLGLSLKYLWGMVNSLQFVIFMDQWKVNWPPNASMAIKTVRTVALAEFIDTNKVKQKAFDFYGINQTHPYASARHLEVTQAVQGTRYDRITISVVIILFVVSLLVVAIFFTFKSQFKDKLIKALKDLKNSIFWNGLIRFYLQSFLKQTITIGITFATIKLGQSHKKENKPSKIAFAAIESIAMFIVVPILFVHVLKKNRNYLFLSSVKQKFGSLYLGIRTDSFYRIYYVLEFLSVRFLFVTITFAFARYPGILVNMYMLLNNANIIYLGWFKPFDTRSQNNLELINSWMLHLIAYALLLLANLMPNPQNEINVGWAVIGCIGAIFLINFGFIMSLNLQKLLRTIYFWKLKRDILRKKREREEAKQLQSIELVVRPLVPEQASPQVANLVSEDQRLTVIPLKQRPVTPLLQEIANLQHNVDRSLLRISSLNDSVRNDSDSYLVQSEDSVFVPSHNSALVKSHNFAPQSSHDSLFVSSYDMDKLPQRESYEIDELPPNSALIQLMDAPLAGNEKFKAQRTPSIPLNEEKSVMELIVERATRREPRMEPQKQPKNSIIETYQQKTENQKALDQINQRIRERKATELKPIQTPAIQFIGIDEALKRLDNIVTVTGSQPPSRTSRF